MVELHLMMSSFLMQVVSVFCWPSPTTRSKLPGGMDKTGILLLNLGTPDAPEPGPVGRYLTWIIDGKYRPRYSGDLIAAKRSSTATRRAVLASFSSRSSSWGLAEARVAWIWKLGFVYASTKTFW